MRIGLGLQIKPTVAAGPPPPPPTPYQKWFEYPDSSVLTAVKPSQLICQMNYVSLCVTDGTFYMDGNALRSTSGKSTNYALSGSVWVEQSKDVGGFGVDGFLDLRYPLYECNSNVYSDSTLATVKFAKTTDKDRYQQWSDLPPDSPVSVAFYPNQCIRHDSGDGRDYLYCTLGAFYKMGNGQLASKWSGVSFRSYQGSAWSPSDSFTKDSGINVASGVTQTNVNIYGEESLTTIYKAKTTAK